MFTLGRKIDFNYKTNKTILILAVATGLAGHFIIEDIMSALYIGMGTFLTWALAREVDPKHDYSAFVCLTISLVNLFYYRSISLIILFWIILILRLLNGITGKAITQIDILAVLALSLYLSIDLKNSIYIVPFISAIMTLNKIHKKTKFKTAILIISIGIFLLESFYFKMFEFTPIDFSNKINIGVIGLSIVFSIWINFIRIEDLKDDQGSPVNKTRIRAGQMLFSNTVLLLLLFSVIGLNNLIIYMSVMVGIIVYSLIGR